VVSTAEKAVVNEVADEREDWLLIGRIIGAHGLNGHVKVAIESDFPERFTEAGDRWLKKADGQPVLVKLVSGRYLEGKNQYLVKLAGVDFRDQAEALRQAELLVKGSDRLPLEPGEFHVSDLIGLAVIMQSDQTILGTVTDVFTTGHDMLEVTLVATADDSVADEPGEIKDISHPSIRAKAAEKLKRQAQREAKKKAKKKAPKTLLIPFVEEIVPVVDIATGRIEITPPAGLIDL
jgi:16S rRNA processing protein RimM